MSSTDVLDVIARESDEDRRWEGISTLVASNPISARQAATLGVVADEPRLRRTAADVLGQVADSDRSARPAIAQVLLSRLADERDATVLASLILAIGHTLVQNARRAIAGYGRHDDRHVRFAVATALPAIGLDSEALGVLRELSADTDAAVRDWATFFLAESEATDPETVAALAARADDPDIDTRAEAIFGLARRKDWRAQSLIKRELSSVGHTARIDEALEELKND